MSRRTRTLEAGDGKTPKHGLGPTGLLARAILIVVVPILLLQAVVAFTIAQRHYDRVSRQLTTIFAREFEMVAVAVNDADSEEGAKVAVSGAASIYGVEFTLDPETPVSPGVVRSWYDVTGGVAADQLDAAFEAPLRAEFPPDSKLAVISVETRYGALVAHVMRNRLVAVNPYLLLTWTSGATILLMIVSLLYLANQIRPIRKLSTAMRAFGDGRVVALRPRGAREVRQASKAFLEMRRRIQRHIEQRKILPLALSHDLRTPITRMRLALEMGAEADELKRSLEEMNEVVEDFLEFARAEWRDSGEPTEIAALVSEAVERASCDDRQLETLIELPVGREWARLRPGAIRRGLGNLLLNAMRYGNRIRVSARHCDRDLEFVVEDDGPGLPDWKGVSMIAQLNRLNSVADASPGEGVRLGLLIVREVALLHGGELRLDASPDLGGLRATIAIPRDDFQ